MSRLKGVMWRVGIFVSVCVLGTLTLIFVFAQVRFTSGTTYSAQFTNVSNLRKGNFVRIAGVEVGKVDDIAINSDATVQVKFTTDASVPMTESTRAEIRYDDLIGGRYLELVEGKPGARRLSPSRPIPTDRTKPALDLDAVTGGFRPLLRGVNPDEINALSGQLIKSLQGEGATIGLFLDQAAAVTNTLADRDLLIGQVISNLDVVLGSLGGQSQQLDKAVTSASELISALAARKTDISNAVAYTSAATGSIAELLKQGRQPLRKVIHETDRTATNVLADHDYLDNFLNVLPDKYRMLSRQGINGDFFNFYFCDVLLKLNGKGGEPVYIKVAGQSSGRCTPK